MGESLALIARRDKLTTQRESAPDVQLLREVVLDTWEHGTEGVCNILWNLARRPVMSSPFVAAKVLIVVHRLMQHGPEEALPMCSKSATLMQGIQNTWEAARRGPWAKERSWVDLIVAYAKVVAGKAVFHGRHSAFTQTYGLHRESFPPDLPQALDELVEMLDACASLLRVAVDKVEEAHREGKGLVVAIAVPSLKEMDSLYNACTAHFYAAATEPNLSSHAASHLRTHTWPRLARVHTHVYDAYILASMSELFRAEGAVRPDSMPSELPNPFGEGKTVEVRKSGGYGASSFACFPLE